MSLTSVSPTDADPNRVDGCLTSTAPSATMSPSELDGFLTGIGIAIGPDFVSASEWLAVAWHVGNQVFDDEAHANAYLGSLVTHCNEILREIGSGEFVPLFDKDDDGLPVAFGWAEGFMRAVKLRAYAWEPLFRSERHARWLAPIGLLH
jgi:uncharacterized protein